LDVGIGLLFISFLCIFAFALLEYLVISALFIIIEWAPLSLDYFLFFYSIQKLIVSIPFSKGICRVDIVIDNNVVSYSFRLRGRFDGFYSFFVSLLLFYWLIILVCLLTFFIDMSAFAIIMAIKVIVIVIINVIVS